MKKINDYIRYLLTLILLEGIKVFAQITENLSQISSQANQELSNLNLSSNSSLVNSTFFSEIIKQSIDKFGYYFINYALPFLIVFGILSYLTYESKKELNRPLLLIYLIIAFLATEFFHALIIILTVVFIFILIIFGLYKISHNITGSIIGSIIVIILAYIVLTGSGIIIGFPFSLASYILLFIFFIAIVILGIRAYSKISSSENFREIERDIKYVYYKLRKRKPQDIKNFEEPIEDVIKKLEELFKDTDQKIGKLSSELTNSSSNHDEIKKLYNDIENFFKECDDIKQTHLKNWGEFAIKNYKGLTRASMLGFLDEKEKYITNLKYRAWTTYSDKILRDQQKVNLLQSILQGLGRNIKTKL